MKQGPTVSTSTGIDRVWLARFWVQGLGCVIGVCVELMAHGFGNSFHLLLVQSGGFQYDW